VGNDINYDGGYGEDSDFGLSLMKIGVTVLQNPFATNLHLKPASGGYRFGLIKPVLLEKKKETTLGVRRASQMDSTASKSYRYLFYLKAFWSSIAYNISA